MYELDTTIPRSFHGLLDELHIKPVRITRPQPKGYAVVQEREVSYRFYPHFHPYVAQLTHNLIRSGTAALQASDTDYEPCAQSMPFSVVVQIGVGRPLTIEGDARFSIVKDLNVMAGGAPLTMMAGTQLTLRGAADATAPGGLQATLVEGTTDTPDQGADLHLTEAAQAVLSGDASVQLEAAAAATLHDGTPVTLPAKTEVRLADSSVLTLRNGTSVTVVRWKPKPKLYADIFSKAAYDPGGVVQRPYPVRDLDFSPSGGYSVYNWELFFHVPFTIAIHLSKNQRYAEAQQWFHYVFDPTDDSDGPTPERFWKVRPFQATDMKKIEEILINLATAADPALRNDTIRSIEAWQDAPFRPHVIARHRQQAYMYKTVMAYLDNLIDWGDSLFRQDSPEAVDGALMQYILAAEILGHRPQPVPKKGSVRPQTYENLRHDLAQFGTAMREVEADVPFDLVPLPGAGGEDSRLAAVRSLGKALYFCVPPNEKLLGYWDTVADRLFKIRNSLNIQGVFRQLALFEPPIDPALLARAVAAGLDVGAIVNGLNQPLPLVRFQLLVQKAAEIAQQVVSFGNGLLSAMEKEDGEGLALLRAKHERVILEMVETVKYGQHQEATKAKEGLWRSLALAVQRYTFYEQQLGKQPDEIAKAIAPLDPLDEDAFQKMKLDLTEPDVAARRPIDVDIATDAFAQAGKFLSGGKILSSHEVKESILLEEAQLAADVSNILNTVGASAHYVPVFHINMQPFGTGGTTAMGGEYVGNAIGGFAAAAHAISDRLNFEARRAARSDAFARRERDWAFQSNLAAGEIAQIYKQLRAAELREAVAEQELNSHRQQIKNAHEIEQFLNEEGTDASGKATNKALYAWMKREVKGLFAQSFQLAFDVARKAERALQHELGRSDLSFVQFGYLAGKEGLLAGEKLYLDLKRMEMAHHDLNAREYELTKHVSVLQLDPIALLELRATGRCTVRLPEALFDMDGPGQYFRRIKSVAVTIPCVTGPYSGVSCKLTLLNSSIRKTPVLQDGTYSRQDAEDDRFEDYFGSMQSIVASSAQNDAGLFETNLRDERYLPFEHAGVISEWQLELPANPSKDEPCQFDYETISDVILHLRYTAREGGELLRKGAIDTVKELADAGEATGSVRLFSVRHEFPDAWAKLKAELASPSERHPLVLELRAEHYPFWSQGRLNSVKRVDLFARSTRHPVPQTLTVFPNDRSDAEPVAMLDKESAMGDLLRGQLTTTAPPVGALKLFLEDNALNDVWVAVTWARA